MSNADAVNERAAAIRQYLSRDNADARLVAKYAKVAARWEELRLLQHKGLTRPHEDDRLRELGMVLQGLGEKLGLGAEITGWRGFLPGDPARIICNGWREAAELWFG
jgi:hypothetical protein